MRAMRTGKKNFFFCFQTANNNIQKTADNKTEDEDKDRDENDKH
jgi:hypothetical protein